MQHVWVFLGGDAEVKRLLPICVWLSRAGNRAFFQSFLFGRAVAASVLVEGPQVDLDVAAGASPEEKH